MRLRGAFTALITPFKGKHIDFEALEKIVEWQIASGINGLVPCGSTGEFATLSHQEQTDILKACVHVGRGRVPIIAGCSDINPYTVIELAHNAKACGVDAFMVVAPYYVKPTQEQIHDFYTLISNAVQLPLLLYNNPGRCAINMSVDTVVKLSSNSNIIGIKDADSDVTRPTMYLNRIARDDFSILSGNSSSTVGFLAQGGHGVISVTSNVDPMRVSNMVEAWFKKDFVAIDALRQALIELDNGLYIEPAPASIKYALSTRGFCEDGVRAPLSKLGEKSKLTLKAILDKLPLGDSNV